MASKNHRRRSDRPTQSNYQSTGLTKAKAKIDQREHVLRFIKKYWVVALPAILLNGVFVMDDVIGKNRQEVFQVRLKEAARAAIQDEEPLSETLRAHWIATNEDGDVEGRISAIEAEIDATVPIEELDVTLLQKGEKIAKAKTDASGKFLLEDVEPGVYTLVASGQSGFLAYGVHVLPKLKQFDVLDFNAGLDQESKNQNYYVNHHGVPKGVVVQDKLQIDAAAIPPEFTTLERISENYLSSASALGIARDTDDHKAIGKASKIGGGFKFQLAADGSFNGRIQPIATNDGKATELSEMNIFLLQDDLEVARVAVKQNGDFKIEDVEEGVYAVLAAGKDGFAALSLELVKPADDEQSNLSKTGVHYVSTAGTSPTIKPAPAFGIAFVADRRDLRAIRSEVRRAANLRRAAVNNNPFNQFQQQPAFQQNFYRPPGSLANGGFPQGSFPTGNFPINAPGPFYSAPIPQGGFPVSYAPPAIQPPAFNGGLPSGPGFRPIPGANGGLLVGALLIGLGIDAIDDDSGFNPSNGSPTGATGSPTGATGSPTSGTGSGTIGP